MPARGKRPIGPYTAGEGTLLSDLEILERIIGDDEHGIFISPVIDAEVQLGPSSLDLHLGTELSMIRTMHSTHIDLTASKEKVRDNVSGYSERQRIAPDGFFVLHPGEFALASTLEYFRLPRDIAGRLEGRSSIGRLGLQVHATAGFVDPGFEGALTFELINAGKLPLKIVPGLRLGQICFLRVKEVQVGYMDKTASKYGGRTGIEDSLIHEDPEISG
jgi:dCTP deaminase